MEVNTEETDAIPGGRSLRLGRRLLLRRRRQDHRQRLIVIASAIIFLTLLQGTPCSTAAGNSEYTFALIPKSMNNPFFESSRDGCIDKAAELSSVGGSSSSKVNCMYIGPETDDPDGTEQAEILSRLIEEGSNGDGSSGGTGGGGGIDGIGISVRNPELIAPLIERAIHKHNIPVVTFDSDVAVTTPTSGDGDGAGSNSSSRSSRLAYVGTDNYFFGRQIAKVLKQLVPNGGTYATVGTSSPNIEERLRGLKDELQHDHGDEFHRHDMRDGDDYHEHLHGDHHHAGAGDGIGNSPWTEVPGSPFYYEENLTLAVEAMDDMAASYNPTALVPVLGGPMRSGIWTDLVDRNRRRNITYVSGDAMPNQLLMLNSKYAHGLVGQLPYEMGSLSIQVLFDVAAKNASPTEEFIGTNVLHHVLVPLKLPPLVVDHNLIGDLNLVGYILFGIVCFTAATFAMWSFLNRNEVLVKVAQPFFLAMIAIGVIIMSSALIPMSMDDSGSVGSGDNVGEEEDGSRQYGVAICMSVPWLASCGFTITFSALFSKTMRINKLFQSKELFRKELVGKRDVLLPFAVLFGLNVIILSLWTALDPLSYVRLDHPGTDGWNRTISSYGTCKSEHVIRYLIPLAVVNLSVLVIANWQTYNARFIKSEFSEKRYVGFAMASLLQSMLVGVPILYVVRQSPQAYYLVLSFTIFVVSMIILLVIFVPKIVISHQRINNEEQLRIVQNSIRRSSSLSPRRQLEALHDSAGTPSSGRLNIAPPMRMIDCEDSSTSDLVFNSGQSQLTAAPDDIVVDAVPAAAATAAVSADEEAVSADQPRQKHSSSSSSYYSASVELDRESGAE